MASIMFIEMSPSGGLFQYGFQLGSQLARLGHQVTIVTGPDPELTSDDPHLVIDTTLPTWHAADTEHMNIWLRRLRRPARGLRHIHALLLLLRIIQRDKPDAVFFQPLRFPMDSWLVQLCRVVSPRTRRCMVMHETRPLSENRREGSLYREERWIDRFLTKTLRRSVGRMHSIFVLGESARDDAVQRWAPRAPITIIPHGDEDVFLDREQVTGAAQTAPTILFFGIWTRHKGIPQLIEAYSQVVEKVPDARLVIAGAVQADIDLQDILELSAPYVGIELRPGYVPFEDVPDLFVNARVVAIPYLRANQSGVVHLAQSFARPIVATDVGDIPTAVSDGESGFVVPPGDVPALTDALLSLLTDPALAERLGSAGRQRLSSEASWGEIASKVADTVLGSAS